MKAVAYVVLIALLSAACSAPLPAATTAATPAAAGTSPPGRALNASELKLKLLANYPEFFYCDPDQYPVAQGDELELALARWESVRSNAEEFAAILGTEHLAGVSVLSNEQKLAVYRSHKRLNAIALQPDGDSYRFTIRVAPEGAKQGFAVEGTITRRGSVTETKRQPTIVTCPICLPSGALIATPTGPVPVEQMTPGMEVWTRDASGARVSAIVLLVARTPVPAGHELARIQLSDGRVALASPGHPSATGAPLGTLRPGARLDGALVTAVERIAYAGGFTYDLLPSGASGVYWADGVPLASTLTQRR